jgi:hypothetical protein
MSSKSSNTNNTTSNGSGSSAPSTSSPSDYEPKIISGYEHSYAHRDTERYAYIGKDDGQPEWIDYGKSGKGGK